MWEMGGNVEVGMYCIKYYGDLKNFLGSILKFEGMSDSFELR